MSPNPEERRKFRRHLLKCELPVLNKNRNFLYLGVVKNISLNGVLIESLEAIQTTEVRVLILEDKSSHIGESFDATLKLIWTRKVGEKFLSGFEFTELPHQTLESVRSIIDQLGLD